jgi:hypothetical protein
VVLDEQKITRFFGKTKQGHLSLFGRSIPLLGVALDARADQILPCVLAAPVLGNHMVDRESAVRYSAVLTLVIVSLDDVAPGQEYPLSGNVDETAQPHDAGKGHGRGDRPDYPMIPFDHFGLSQIEQNNGFLCAAHAHRFVILV